MRNLAQGVLLVAVMAALAGFLAWLLFGPQALPWALAAVVLIGLLRPRIPARRLLEMHGARPLRRRWAPALYDIVDELSRRARLSRSPAVYYIPTAVPNAFAVGRGGAATLVVTDGLLRLLGRRPLAGVLAHEISHIRNGDTTIMSVSDLIGRMVHVLAMMGIWSVLLTLPLAVSVGPTTRISTTRRSRAIPKVWRRVCSHSRTQRDGSGNARWCRADALRTRWCYAATRPPPTASDVCES